MSHAQSTVQQNTRAHSRAHSSTSQRVNLQQASTILPMSCVLSSVVSTDIAYSSVLCIKRERFATQHFVSITVDVHGLPEVDEKQEIVSVTVSQ